MAARKKSTTVYFKTFHEARDKQREIGGESRVVQYDRGFAVQYHKSGPYFGDEVVSKNPLLMTFGNPGKLMGTDVLAVIYRHAEDGKLYCHGFGDADIELKTRGDSLTITALKETTGVKMHALPDGSIRISKPGVRVWEDL